MRHHSASVSRFHSVGPHGYVACGRSGSTSVAPEKVSQPSGITAEPDRLTSFRYRSQTASKWRPPLSRRAACAAPGSTDREERKARQSSTERLRCCGLNP